MEMEMEMEMDIGDGDSNNSNGDWGGVARIYHLGMGTVLLEGLTVT